MTGASGLPPSDKLFQCDIPGYGHLMLNHLVLDFNGTVACDGRLLQGVNERLNSLAAKIEIHVLTADTFGHARSELENVACRLSVLPAGNQEQRKLQYVQQLGPGHTMCIGDGRNDRLMLREAALSVVVVQGEGAALETLLSADIVSSNILDALDLLAHPLRLVATLRS